MRAETGWHLISEQRLHRFRSVRPGHPEGVCCMRNRDGRIVPHNKCRSTLWAKKCGTVWGWRRGRRRSGNMDDNQ
jgi:hypothetical protein